MTIDERLEAIAAMTQESSAIIKEAAALSKENNEGIKDLLITTREHTKQLEIDGQHIRQLAMAVQDHQIEITKMTNGINALVELAASHETRIHRIEGNQ
jgi:DNA-binding helix-hairpin-helix protein with protein kinase domain